MAAAEDLGELEQAEEEMIYKVFDFAEKEVHEVMVPRPQIVALSVEMPLEDALTAVIDSPYTRYPAYRESLDDIAGILHVRDLFAAIHDRGLVNVRLDELVRPAYFVPETKALAALLADFRRTKRHMAIVVDEYGAMEGIVTLEDVLEEIVGEIEDEFDLPDESVERIDEHTCASTARSRSTTSTSSSAPRCRSGTPHDGGPRVRDARPRAGGRRHRRG